MVESGAAKSTAFGIMGVLLWITNNLGIAFYILIAAYILDFALHYSQKQEFIQRITLYLGSTFFSYYLQNTDTFMTIPLLRGLIIMMAVHEVIEVLTEVRTRLKLWKPSDPAQAAEVTQLETLLQQFQDVIPILAATQAIQAPVNTPAASVPPPNTALKGVDAP